MFLTQFSAIGSVIQIPSCKHAFKANILRLYQKVKKCSIIYLFMDIKNMFSQIECMMYVYYFVSLQYQKKYICLLFKLMKHNSQFTSLWKTV